MFIPSKVGWQVLKKSVIEIQFLQVDQVREAQRHARSERVDGRFYRHKTFTEFYAVGHIENMILANDELFELNER